MKEGETKTAYTIKETAQQLGIPVATVRRLVASNQLASTLDPNGKFGPTRMIAATAIEAYRKGELPPVESLHEHNRDCVPLWVLDAESAEVERLTKELESTQKELSTARQDRVSADNAAVAQHDLIVEYAHKVLTLDEQKDQFIETQRQHIEALVQFNALLADSLRRVLEPEATQ